MRKVVLIGGYDPTGGAGISADLRAAVTEGVYPIPVPTVLTIQDKEGLKKLYEVQDRFFEEALGVALSTGVSSIKVGLVVEPSKMGIIKRVNEKLGVPVVLDPVLSVSRGGYKASEDLINAIKGFIPHTLMVTPNRDELKAITGEDDVERALKVLKSMGARYVLVKGGDRNPPIDMLFDGENIEIIQGELVKGEFHGTGCSLASLIASNIAKGMGPRDAVLRSIEILREGLRHPIEIKDGWFTPFTSLPLEKIRVLRDLENAFSLVKGLLSPRAVPEVGMNLCYSLPNPKGVEDVAGFPGRIHRVKDRIVNLYPPEFGGSSHVARVVVTAYKESGGVVRSAMNIRFDERYLEFAEKRGIRPVFIDRSREPKGAGTMEWVTQEAFKVEKLPRIVYDRGDVGKEAMIRILGRTPFEVVDTALTITGGR